MTGGEREVGWAFGWNLLKSVEIGYNQLVRTGAVEEVFEGVFNEKSS
jgi:hypothetical protein